MSSVRRWLRLDITWSGSEWIVTLRPGGRLAWIELLGYVKANGVAGTAKAMSPKAAGKRWGIPARDVGALLEAAHQDGALRIEGGDWIVTGWATYQEQDPKAAERQRRHRADKSRLSPLRRDIRDRGRDPSRDRDVDVDRDSELRKKAPSGPKKARAAVPFQLPTTWTPNATHDRIASERHVDMELEAAQFRDHAATHGRKALDWNAAFRTWLRKSTPPNGNGAVRGADPSEKLQVSAASMTEHLRRQGIP